MCNKEDENFLTLYKVGDGIDFRDYPNGDIEHGYISEVVIEKYVDEDGEKIRKYLRVRIAFGPYGKIVEVSEKMVEYGKVRTNAK